MTLILIGLGPPAAAACPALGNGPFARMTDQRRDGFAGQQPTTAPMPTETDLAFARTAASDVLTKGDKDSSQPWENPETGARGSVTPLAQAYASDDGRTCRDFLASYVNGRDRKLAAGRGLPRPATAAGKSIR